MPEFRARIAVAGLDVEDEDRWMALADALERHHGEKGPVLGWDGDGLEVVFAVDAADETEAGTVMADAVADSLANAGLGELRPGRVEIELVE